MTDHPFLRRLHLLPALQSLRSGSIFQFVPILITTLRTLAYNAAKLDRGPFWAPNDNQLMLPAIGAHVGLKNLVLEDLADHNLSWIMAPTKMLPVQINLQNITISRSKGVYDKSSHKHPATCPFRLPSFEITAMLRDQFTELKSLSVDAYFLLDSNRLSLEGRAENRPNG